MMKDNSAPWPFSNNSTAPANTASITSSAAAPSMQGAPVEDLSKVLHSALVGTRTTESSDATTELMQLMETQAYRMLLQSIRMLSRQQGISERQAAEQMVRTFRRIDEIWSDLVFKEGVDRLRGKFGSKGT